MRQRFERTTRIAAPIADVFAFFGAPANLGRITPPEMGFRITDGPDRPLRAGDRISYRIRIMGIPIHWRTLITRWEDSVAFADLQERGPYRYWLHTHTFRDLGNEVEMHDLVEYELPLGVLGRLFGGWFVRRQLEAIFDYRADVIDATFRAPDRARIRSAR
ncbi:MAG TPA: SRPBCC family protein [Thermoanaerobaculia bacterium]